MASGWNFKKTNTVLVNFTMGRKGIKNVARAGCLTTNEPSNRITLSTFEVIVPILF
jgi:hypothetical protein